MRHGKSSHGFFASRANIVLLVFLAVAGFYLVSEHRAHLVGTGPLLLLLGLCVGMHFFMHGRHSGHGGEGNEGNPSPGGGLPATIDTEHGTTDQE